jgi:hypothetical protein
MFVSKHDIDLLVSAMRQLGSHVRIEARHDRADRIDPNALGRMLWAENVKSFPHEAELQEKRAEMAKLEASLAATEATPVAA